MATEKKRRPAKRTSSFYKSRRIARRLERQAEALKRDAARDEQPLNAAASSQINTNRNVTTSSGYDENSSVEHDILLPSKNDDSSREKIIRQLKRRTESFRRRMMALEKVVTAQAETIEKQGNAIESAKSIEIQLRTWRVEIREALDFLLWERTGPHSGAYRDKNVGLWSQLGGYHKYY